MTAAPPFLVPVGMVTDEVQPPWPSTDGDSSALHSALETRSSTPPISPVSGSGHGCDGVIVADAPAVVTRGEIVSDPPTPSAAPTGGASVPTRPRTATAVPAMRTPAM